MVSGPASPANRALLARARPLSGFMRPALPVLAADGSTIPLTTDRLSLALKQVASQWGFQAWATAVLPRAAVRVVRGPGGELTGA